MPTFNITLPKSGGTFYVMKLSEDDLDNIATNDPGFWDAVDIGEEKYCVCSAELGEAVVEDEEGNHIETIDFTDTDDLDLGVVVENYSKDGIYSILYQYESGFFGVASINADVFEREKLRVEYVSFNEVGYDVQLITAMYYDGKELEIDTGNASLVSQNTQCVVVKTDEKGQAIKTIYHSEDH